MEKYILRENSPSVWPNPQVSDFLNLAKDLLSIQNNEPGIPRVRDGPHLSVILRNQPRIFAFTEIDVISHITLCMACRLVSWLAVPALSRGTPPQLHRYLEGVITGLVGPCQQPVSLDLHLSWTNLQVSL